MLQSHQVEQLITSISAMDRDEVEDQLKTFRASFPLDFTSEYLSKQSTERLRHIFLAVCLQSKRMPKVGSLAA